MPAHSNAANKTNNLDSTKRNGQSNGNNNNNSNGIYGVGRKTSGGLGSLPSSSSGNNNNNNNIRLRDNDDNSCIDTNSLKHPVGLEAIKEMTRNKNIENLS